MSEIESPFPNQEIYDGILTAYFGLPASIDHEIWVSISDALRSTIEAEPAGVAAEPRHFTFYHIPPVGANRFFSLSLEYHGDQTILVLSRHTLTYIENVLSKNSEREFEMTVFHDTEGYAIRTPIPPNMQNRLRRELDIRSLLVSDHDQQTDFSHRGLRKIDLSCLMIIMECLRGGYYFERLRSKDQIDASALDEGYDRLLHPREPL